MYNNSINEDHNQNDKSLKLNSLMHTTNFQKKIILRATQYCQKENIKFKIYNTNSFHHRSGTVPSGKILRFGLFSSKKQIAHYAFIPRILIFNNKKFLGGQSSNVWVKKNFEGKGLSVYLIFLALNYLKNNNFKFHYGFPNENMFKIWKDGLNVKYLGNAAFVIKPNNIDKILIKLNISIPGILIKILNNIVHFSLKFFLFSTCNTYKVIKIKKFPPQLREYLAKNFKNNAYHFEKNIDELKWRYESDKYQLFICYDKLENICGYLVGTIQEKEGLQISAILDYHVNKKNAYSILKLLIKEFEQHYSSSNLHAGIFFKHQPQIKELRKLGYFKLNTNKQKRSFWMFFQSLTEDYVFDYSEDKWNISFYDSTDSF